MRHQSLHAALATTDASVRLATILAPLVRAEIGSGAAPTEAEIALVLAPSLGLLRQFQEAAGETEHELKVVHGLFGSVKGPGESADFVSSAMDQRCQEIASAIAACWVDDRRMEVATATVFLQLEYLVSHGERTYRAEADLWQEPIYRRPGLVQSKTLLKAYQQWLCLVASQSGTPRGIPLVVWRRLSGDPQARGLGRRPRLSGGTWRSYSYVARFPTLEAEESLVLVRYFHPADVRDDQPLSLRKVSAFSSVGVASKELSLLSWRDACWLASRLSKMPRAEWTAVLAEAQRGVGP